MKRTIASNARGPKENRIKYWSTNKKWNSNCQIYNNKTKSPCSTSNKRNKIKLNNFTLSTNVQKYNLEILKEGSEQSANKKNNQKISNIKNNYFIKN